MDRFFFLAGAIAAFIAVALGAFGAHSLKTKLSPEMLNIFEVGVRYQMYHALRPDRRRLGNNALARDAT